MALDGRKYRYPIREVTQGIDVSYILKDECRSLVHNPWAISGKCIKKIRSDKKNLSQYEICQTTLNVNSHATAANSVLHSLNLGLELLTHYKSILGSLEAIDIVLFPHYNFLASFEKNLYKSTMTDNASWSVTKKNNKRNFQLAVLPTSEQWVKRGYIPMWQSPFVINHELGHHVFYSLLPVKIKKSYFSSASIISNYHKHVDDKLSQMTGHIKSNYLEFSSINEAVADLFAFVVLKQQSRNLGRIHCGLSYRNILDEKFPSGNQKSFNEDLESDNKCFEPMANDPHLWGSIIAHATYKILTINSDGSKDSIEKMFFEFLSIFKNKLQDSTKKDINRIGLEPYVESLITIANIDGDLLEECDLIDEFFSRRYRKLVASSCS